MSEQTRKSERICIVTDDGAKHCGVPVGPVELAAAPPKDTLASAPSSPGTPTPPTTTADAVPRPRSERRRSIGLPISRCYRSCPNARKPPSLP